MPGSGGAAQIASAEVTDYGPGIERGERHDDSQQEDADGGEFSVQRMLPQTDMGLLERERVCDPEDDESDDGGAGGRNDAVGQDAVPGVQLAHFFPPLIVDGPGAQPAQRYKQDDDEDGVPKATAASLAAGNLTVTK